MPNLTIANGATTSDALQLDSIRSGVVLQFPAAMTGTAVAVHGSIDGTNFYPVYNDNVALSITVVASSIHVISPVKLHGLESIKFVSGSAEGAARTLTVNNVRAV